MASNGLTSPSEELYVMRTMSKERADQNRHNTFSGVLHHHIPKTAGTSVKKLISEAFRPGEVMPAGWFSRNNKLPHRHRVCFDKYKLISVHANLIDEVPKEWFAFTLLRDPIRRVVSLCSDWASLTDADLKSLDEENRETKKLARILSAAEMLSVDSKQASQNLRNGMVKSVLARSNITAAAIDDAPEWAAKKALARCIETLNFIGEVEQLEASMSELQEMLQLRLPKLQIINRSNAPPRPLTGSEQKALTDANQADLMFYSMARKQLSVHGNRVSLWRQDNT